MTVAPGDAPRVLWTPPPDVRETTEIGRYLAWLESERGLVFGDYDALQRWSVDDLTGFWASIWDFFEVKAEAPYSAVLASDAMPGAVWFPDARLNFAEHLVGRDEDAEQVAIVAHSQTRDPVELTFAAFRDQVARARAGLRRLGVGPGDRVVAYLPNIPETLVAFAATASLGAVWASCAPELGPRSVVDRLGQLEPTVLLTVGGYGYRDRSVDRRSEVAEIREALPTLRHVVHVPYGEHVVPDAVSWDELLAETAALQFAPVPFDQPLFVLFSSGTTGKPKAIVHGHGGILLELSKAHALSWDLKPGGRLLWFSTTAWMMWNALVAALLVRSSVVMLDGDPDVAGPRLAVAARRGDPPDLHGREPRVPRGVPQGGAPAGSRPRPRLDPRVRYGRLPAARRGVPLGLRAARAGRAPRQRQRRDGRLQRDRRRLAAAAGLRGRDLGRLLGVATEAFDLHGEPVVGELGELVITRPMPSMPVGLWGDADGSRYRSAYFDMFPGVWRQGDWVRFSERGSCVVSGRSDATLNRGGVRLGTGEFYGVIEELPQLTDSLVVHLEDAEGGPGELVLFVVLADGVELDDELWDTIERNLRHELSPRHVPDAIHAVPAIPRTLTGKKLETPVKQILRGTPADRVASRDALLDPAALDPFVALASATAGRAGGRG